MHAVRHCPVCGQLLTPPAVSCPNRWCRRPDRGFSVAFAIGPYRGGLRRAIFRYKYRGRRGLAPVFAGMVATYVSAHPGWFEEFDVVTGVPSYTGPGARRNWDPVGAVLAELPASFGAGFAVEPGLVVKARETPGMAGLAWAERQAVARGPLRASLHPGEGRSLEGSRVLVLDDVLTDGSTLREVAGVLRAAGASDVAGLVLARAEWSAGPPGRPAM